MDIETKWEVRWQKYKDDIEPLGIFGEPESSGDDLYTIALDEFGVYESDWLLITITLPELPQEVQHDRD